MSTLGKLKPAMLKPERSSPLGERRRIERERAAQRRLVHREQTPRSTPRLASSCSVAKLLPVNTSTSGLASCCRTISESAARSMRARVSSGV